jgi:hypothetical protein
VLGCQTRSIGEPLLNFLAAPVGMNAHCLQKRIGLDSSYCLLHSNIQICLGIIIFFT